MSHVKSSCTHEFEMKYIQNYFFFDIYIEKLSIKKKIET